MRKRLRKTKLSLENFRSQCRRQTRVRTATRPGRNVRTRPPIARGPPSHAAPHPQADPVRRPAGPGLDLNFREGWEWGRIRPQVALSPTPQGSLPVTPMIVQTACSKCADRLCTVLPHPPPAGAKTLPLPPLLLRGVHEARGGVNGSRFRRNESTAQG